MNLKIFTYNVRGLPFISDKWLNPLVTWFSSDSNEYDFICLQEVFTPEKVAMLRPTLESNYAVYEPTTSTRPFNSGLITAIKRSWQVLKEEFISFNLTAGAELLADKGFHAFHLKHATGYELVLINTHMQSDNFTNYFALCYNSAAVRNSQAAQIYTYLRGAKPHLIVGDINSEVEPHEDMVYLTGVSHGIKKHTFIPTGEDLDHIVIVPKFYGTHKLPSVKDIRILNKLKCSDHWALDILVNIV